MVIVGFFRIESWLDQMETKVFKGNKRTKIEKGFQKGDSVYVNKKE